MSELVADCAFEWFFQRPEVRTQDIIPGTSKGLFEVRVPNRTPANLARVQLELANSGFRYVKVHRADINDAGRQIALTPITSAMAGGVAVSWGALLTGTTGHPTLRNDYADFRPTEGAAKVRYWVLGFGWGPHADSSPL